MDNTKPKTVWNDKLEHVVLDIGESSKAYKIMHIIVAQQASKSYSMYMLVGIILGPLSGVISGIGVAVDSENILDLNKAINDFKNVGYVPTMGGIHNGHISLIKKSQKKCEKTLVSIFVNPTQFNDKSDFKKYPRNVNNDIKILKKHKVDYLFIPYLREIYKKNTKKININNKDKILCARKRKGHFDGVLTVMNRLLNLIKSKYVFMGEKDYQQLFLIKKYLSKKYKIKIINCPIIRDKNRLALSTRNVLLSKKNYFKACSIANYLSLTKKKLNKKNLSTSLKLVIKKLENLHLWFRQNRWLKWFTICTRCLVAFGFILPGYVKVIGERFTDLHNNQPMGHYLQALFETGYYYTFIGVMQIVAGILLLIPRTVLLGVLIYFPIILNICILSWSVRFEGSLFTSPLMVIACLYLFWWNFDRLKYILPFPGKALPAALPRQELNNKFPWLFFSFVAMTLVGVTTFAVTAFEVLPRNTLIDCNSQFKGTNRTQAGAEFCDCIHVNGRPVSQCLEEYEKAADDKLTN